MPGDVDKAFMKTSIKDKSRACVRNDVFAGFNLMLGHHSCFTEPCASLCTLSSV